MDIMISTLSTMAVSIVTALFTVHLAMRQFRADKWWERKHESYTRLLQVIHRMVRYAEAHLDDVMGEQKLAPEESRELEHEWRVLHREYCEARDLADFDLSADAVEALEKYEAAKDAARNEDDIDLWIEGDLAASRQCLVDIKGAARRDLRVG